MTLRALHDAAREALDPVRYDYVAGGAGEERVLAANEQAFESYRLLPRVLCGSETRDTAVDLPGARQAAPVIVAPTAFHRLMHPDGERATARAAAAEGAVLVTGTAATTAVDAVVAGAPAAPPAPPRWVPPNTPPPPAGTQTHLERAAA
ncbi:alpha-hydroxy-acid oxidizing protein, partial [Streptomyces olivaceus]|uniref:alpha-hydroxy-acid oxidizing protein n=1 Tax=Streptomyces olivaceus TaxID=47716 RepID=UPI004056B4C6